MVGKLFSVYWIHSCVGQMESYDKTPIIPTGQRRATESERKEFSSLFDGSQSEDSSDDDEER